MNQYESDDLLTELDNRLSEKLQTRLSLWERQQLMEVQTCVQNAITLAADLTF